MRPSMSWIAGLALMAVTAAATACAGEPAPATTVTADTPAAALRSQLNQLLSEHVYLAVNATGAALDGRNEEFAASAAALDANSVALAGLIGSAYGDAAGEAFLAGWRRHIGFFVDYTQGVATQDSVKQERAKADLVQYTHELAAFLNSANGLPKETMLEWLRPHHVGLTAVIDAQAAGNDAVVFVGLRAAARHMHMIGDPLAEATVLKFPDKFRVDHLVAHR